MHRISILKFGGTSLSSEDGRSFAAEHVRKSIESGFCPVVVVSAMGRIGDPYSTDTLLSLLGTEKPSSGREVDLLLSCGEIISSVVFSAKLNSIGLKAISMTGQMAGVITDSNFGNASIIALRKNRILEAVEKGLIPVISGFQGSTEHGEITTLGRGGSDITAMKLASGLRASHVCIYKDVDGVMTCDPKKSTDARFLERISAARLLEMVDSGSGLIHRKALEIAISNEIPFRIRNTFPSCRETVVYPVDADNGSAVPLSG